MVEATQVKVTDSLYISYLKNQLINRVGNQCTPTCPGECENCWASTNHGSLAQFGECNFQYFIQNM